MRERGVRARDLRSALVNAADCRPSNDGPGRWRVTGPDVDGDDLTAIVVFENGVVVVTLF